MNLFAIDLSLWRFPASLILGVAFCLALWAADRYYATTRPVRWLTSPIGAVVLIAVAALLLAVEGIWAVGIYHTWLFLLASLALSASLGLITLRGIRGRRGWGFVLNHAGLFVILWGATFGAPDTTTARMIAYPDQPDRLAYTATNQIVPLPFEIRLLRFEIDRYDDGTTPRQFRSTVRLDSLQRTIEVNAPARYRGYTIYQESYDRREGRYSVLLIKRDPWLPVIWIGIAVLAVGSLLLIFKR